MNNKFSCLSDNEHFRNFIILESDKAFARWPITRSGPAVSLSRFRLSTPHVDRAPYKFFLWQIYKLFSLNFEYSNLYLKFWPLKTLNKLENF